MSVEKPVEDAVGAPPVVATGGMADAGSFVLEEADGDGVITVVGSGFWTPVDTDRHFVALEAMMARRRAAGHAVRVLVDLRAAQVQGPETAARVQYWTDTIYAPGDRAALIVASSLVKLQMRRVARIQDREVFISPGAARKWLLAYG